MPVLSRLVALGAAILVVILAISARADETAAEGFTSLFDGRTFTGWNGDTASTWRIEEGAIVAGRPGEVLLHRHGRDHARGLHALPARLPTLTHRRPPTCPSCPASSRSVRIPDHHEVIGFQADIDPYITGAIYDESRRRKMLAVPPQEVQDRALAAGRDGWHDYVIRCEGPRIRLAINGVETVDYTEADPTIPLRGMIALQIHGKLVGTVRYRNIRIREVPAR